MQVVGQQSARIQDLDPGLRYYFEVHFDDSQRVAAAERFLPLQGGVNVRDLGGYPTADGRHVRWGLLFRSGTLSALTEADYIYLQHIGIKLVCDLRSHEEMVAEPDTLPDSMQYLPSPIYTDSDTSRRLRALLFNPAALNLLMREAYTRQMVDQNALTIGEVLRRFADSAHLPALVHCTAGKDRTGIIAAVLLSFLGVPDSVITADYSLSNYYYDTFRRIVEKAIPQRLSMLGITIDDMTFALTANPVLLQAVLDHIRQHYGSVEGYLQDAAHLDAATLERLKATLLE
jgi:protein-tyrosine phosphatase